jgi:hypothetical protein
MKPPRPASSGGRTWADPRPPFEGSEEVTLEYRPDELPLDAARKAVDRVRKAAPLEADLTLEYRSEDSKKSAPNEPVLKLNPMPYASQLTPDRGLQGADLEPRYAEVAPERHFEETPYDLALVPQYSEVTPEPAPELVEEPPLHPPPKPIPPALPPRVHFVPRDLTLEGETNDEYHPPLSDPVSASEITKLPDVKRALDALRAGRMLKPPAAMPYGAGAGGADSKRTVPDSGTPSPSKPRAPAARSSGPALPAAAPARMLPVFLGVLGWLVVAALIAVYALGRDRRVRSPVPASSAVAAPSSPAKPAVEATADPMVVQKIAETPVGELTPEQWVMLARERNLKRSLELRELGHKLLSGVPPAEEVINRLRDAARDPVTAPDALLAMASVAGPTGPDIIYQVANDERLPAETRGLALDLLGTKAMRARASEALGVVLDLGRVKTCEEAEQVVERALKAGDRRALTALNRLYTSHGCGPNKASDCYPCLRKHDRLRRAIEAVRVRQSPS